MSETATAVATAPTDAPATGDTPSALPPQQESGAAAVLTPVESTQGLSARDRAKRAFSESFRPREAAEPTAPAPAAEAARTEDGATPVVDAQGRKHDPETGHFLAETGEDPNAPADAPVAETAETVAETRPTELRIPLPDALRAQGIADLPATPETEQVLKALVNGYTRRAEVEQYQARVAALEEQVLRTQAQEAARTKWEQGLDPETREMLHAVEQVNPTAAAIMRRGLEASIPEMAETEFRTLAEQRAQAQVAEQANHFLQQTETAARQVFADIAGAPYFPALFQQARVAYGADLMAREQRGEVTQPNETDLLTYLRSFIAAHPEAAQVYRQKLTARQDAERVQAAQRAAQQARAEAEQRQAGERAEMAQRHATKHPLGQIAGQIRTDKVSTSGAQDFSSVPSHQRKRAIREALFGGR